MRIHARYIALTYELNNDITKGDVENIITHNDIKDYVIALVDGSIQCIVYKYDKFDITSTKKFKVRCVLPTVNGVNQDQIMGLVGLFKKDAERISSGTNLIDFINRHNHRATEEAREVEEEIIKLKNENKRLRSQIEKMKRASTHVTFNTIINMCDRVVKVNDVGKENLGLLTTDDKREILTQPCDMDIGLKCLEKIHANPNTPENCNLYITNRKNEELTYKKDGRWVNEADYTKVVSGVIRRGMDTLKEFAHDEKIPDVPVGKRDSAINIADGYLGYGKRYTEKVVDMLYSNTKTKFQLETQEIKIEELEAPLVEEL